MHPNHSLHTQLFPPQELLHRKRSTENRRNQLYPQIKATQSHQAEMGCGIFRLYGFPAM